MHATRALTPRELAENLAAAVGGGDALPVVRSPVLLGHDEILHAQMLLAGWRFAAVDVLVDQRRVLALGGPLQFGLAATVNAVRNRSARIRAQQLAAPQWRPLGVMPVLATN